MLRVDHEGVPTRVQSIAYHPYPMLLEVKLFNGKEVNYCVEAFLPHIGLDIRPLTEEEWAQVTFGVEDHVERYWEKLGSAALRVLR